ncbi:hypothetical protein D3C71_1385590 [compost metagenome]
MDQLAKFMRFKCPSQPERIVRRQCDAIAIMVVQALNLLSPNAKRATKWSRESTKMAKIMLVDDTGPVRHNQRPPVLDKEFQLLPGLLPT